MLLNKCKKN